MITKKIVEVVCDGDFHTVNDSVPYSLIVRKYVTVGDFQDWWNRNNGAKIEKIIKGANVKSITYDEIVYVENDKIYYWGN